MRIEHLTYTARRWHEAGTALTALDGAQLVLVFGARDVLGADDWLAPLRQRYPSARIVACSSGGNIAGERVTTEGAVATAVQLESSSCRVAETGLESAASSERAGRTLARALAGPDLQHVLVLAEGLGVNGSALARGLAAELPAGVSVSGGLAADGDRFERTVVGLDGAPSSQRAVAIGFYGGRLDVAVGSYGGWQAFGPEYTITRAEGNVLYELDGRSAFDLYKELLGPLGYALPASGLMFPLKVRSTPGGAGLVRTILGVDEARGSGTFVGDGPVGSSARLVRTTLDDLIEASGIAAERCADGENGGPPGLALAVSCIGRRLLLQQRVEEEVVRVRRAMGTRMHVTGFYSDGELAPLVAGSACELHNQTMTITRILER